MYKYKHVFTNKHLYCIYVCTHISESIHESFVTMIASRITGGLEDKGGSLIFFFLILFGNFWIFFFFFFAMSMLIPVQS